MSRYLIAGLNIDIAAPEWVLHPNLTSFINSGNNLPDIICWIVSDDPPPIPAHRAETIIRTSVESIFNYQGSIHYKCHSEDGFIEYMKIVSDWSEWSICVHNNCDKPKSKLNSSDVVNNLFNVIRKLFSGALAYRNGLLIHSSTIEWQGKGIVFAAPAGTGKSTHTRLWQQRYSTPILDGDVIACRMLEGKPYVYGLPWCGTSEEFINRCVPLGAIVFLEQAGENSIVKLDISEAFIRLSSRCFLTRWHVELTDLCLNTIQDVIEKIDCYLLKCRPDFESVELVKTCLEKNELLDQNAER